MIEEGAKNALKNLKATQPYVPARPTSITMEPGPVDDVAHYKGRPGIEIIDPLKAVSRGKDWMEVWNNMWDWSVGEYNLMMGDD